MPAEARLGLKFFAGLLPLVLSLFLSLPKNAYAVEATERYYDWGSYYEKKGSKVLGLTAAAKENEGTASAKADPKNIAKFNGYFLGLGRGISPNSPLYFLRRIPEVVAVNLAGNLEKKEDIQMKIAARYLEDIERTAKLSQTKDFESSVKAYDALLANVADSLEVIKKNDLTKAEAVLETFEETAARHNLVLQEVGLKAPEAVKGAVAVAVAASERIMDTTADLSGRPALNVDVLNSVQALKTLGRIDEELAQKIVSAPSREQAREELNKLEKEGIVSDTIVFKLNEAVERNFKEEFNKFREIKNLVELNELESQEPDEETKNELIDLARRQGSDPKYSPPPDVARAWSQAVRLVELQNTIRPDLIDANLLPKEYKEKMNDVVRRFQPRPEDYVRAELLRENDPASYERFRNSLERVKAVAEKFGVACGDGLEAARGPSGSFFCAPKGTEIGDFDKVEFNENRSCARILTSARNPNGACVVLPHNCLPAGWTAADSCSTMRDSGGPKEEEINCPTNANKVRMGNSFTCVPRVTFVSYNEVKEGQTSVPRESFCPLRFHRDYPNGPCIPDAYFGPNVSYPTYTPGLFPSPVYPTIACGPGYQAQGFACVRDAEERRAEMEACYTSGKNWNGYACVERLSSEGGTRPGGPIPGTSGNPRADMGNCRTPGECYDWCQANPGKCPGFDSSAPRPGDAVSLESQEAACRAGGGVCVSWVNGACGCERRSDGNAGTNNTNACPAGQYRGPGGNCVSGGSSGGTGSNGSSCPSGQYMGPGGYCISSYSVNSPSSESQEAACRAGGGVCVSWVNGACGCERSGSQSSGTGGSSGGAYHGGGATTPPSGYGACSSDQYWNGSSCVSSNYTPPSQTETPEQSCLRGGGCTWTGSSCSCPSSPPQPTPPPSEPTQPPAQPAPEQAPAPTPYTAPAGESGGGGGSQCPSGQYWNGTNCVQGQY